MVPFSINPSQPCRISCSFIINLDRREANSRGRDCFFPFGLLRYQLEQVPPGSQASYAESGTELTDFNLPYAYVAVATRSYLKSGSNRLAGGPFLTSEQKAAEKDF
jgi:hypothetical protein